MITSSKKDKKCDSRVTIVMEFILQENVQLRYRVQVLERQLAENVRERQSELREREPDFY